MPKTREHHTAETPKGLLNAITNGIVGWLSYQSRLSAHTLYSELFVYPTILEIALREGWQCEGQFQPFKEKQGSNPVGAPQAIDFVFRKTRKDKNAGRAHEDMIVAEVKFLRTRAPSAKDITNDLDKLRKYYATHRIENPYLVCLYIGTMKWIERVLEGMDASGNSPEELNVHADFKSSDGKTHWAAASVQISQK
jgi:hypothetical protein